MKPQEYTVYTMDRWETLERKSGMKTLPQIFRGTDLVGGYGQLDALWTEGKLRTVS